MTIFDELNGIIGKKDVFIYGYGTMGGTAHFTLHRYGYDVKGIVDSDIKKQGQSVGGIVIISPYDLMYYDKDKIMVFVCSDRGKSEVISTLESMDLSRDRNYSTFFLDGRSAPFTVFNPQVGWCRGKNQFVECDNTPNDSDKIILTLGGSTTDYSLNGFVSWPSLLNKKIRGETKWGGYSVLNGGVAGYCSSHELISFIMFGLDMKTIPDVLISYSGYNDSAGVLTYEYNDYHAIKTYDDLNRIASGKTGKSLPLYFGSEIRDSALLWLKNARILHGICDEFGIRHIHILQPTYITSGQLDEVEKEICTTGPYRDIYRKVNEFYDKIKGEMEDYDWITDATDIFTDTSVYIDSCHVNQEGNEIIASYIYRLLEKKNILGEVSK